ncbi:MAG: rubrerythrin family protein [Candidatus Omnitrophica bacterium]|nr:rubrerythrin family protein [Candidatus Omnitrophota bacterium]
MHEMTEQNLKAAFAGESQAHMKYLAFADKAEKESKSNVARLFKAIAYAERVHAINHLKVLNGIGTTEENLQAAQNGEHFEVEEMYPAYHDEAEKQGEKDAARSTHYALEAEKIHEEMYKKTKKEIASGGDIELAEVYICPICGYTVEGDAPDFCPICAAKKGIFKKFA